jgi:hypothetical protein
MPYFLTPLILLHIDHQYGSEEKPFGLRQGGQGLYAAAYCDFALWKPGPEGVIAESLKWPQARKGGHFSCRN